MYKIKFPIKEGTDNIVGKNNLELWTYIDCKIDMRDINKLVQKHKKWKTGQNLYIVITHNKTQNWIFKN